MRARVRAWTGPYRAEMRGRAALLKADGCSGVPDFYRDACLEHDIHYRTGKTFDGQPITRAQADAVFRRRIQSMSVLGAFSPVAQWRWLGVRLFGGRSWKGAS